MSADSAKSFKSTSHVGVTASSQNFLYPVANGNLPVTIRFVSTIGVHLLWKPVGDTTAVTTVNGGYIPAGCVETITMGPNDTIAIIAATGATTGDAWFTQIA